MAVCKFGKHNTWSYFFLCINTLCQFVPACWGITADQICCSHECRALSYFLLYVIHFRPAAYCLSFHADLLNNVSRRAVMDRTEGSLVINSSSLLTKASCINTICFKVLKNTKALYPHDMIVMIPSWCNYNNFCVGSTILHSRYIKYDENSWSLS